MTIPNIVGFAALATEYCGFVEGLHLLGLKQRLHGTATRLAGLYGFVVGSPLVSPASLDAEEYCDDSDFEQVATARALINCEFEQFELYLVPLEPFALATMSDKSLGVAQLSDDVLDV